MARIRSSIYDLAALIVLALGLIGAYSAYQRLSHIELEETLGKLRENSEEARNALRDELNRYEIVLSGVRSIVHDELLVSHPHGEFHHHTSWRNFATSMQEHLNLANNKGLHIDFIRRSFSADGTLQCAISGNVHSNINAPNRAYVSPNLCKNKAFAKALSAIQSADSSGIVPWHTLYPMQTFLPHYFKGKNQKILLALPVFQSEVSPPELQGWVVAPIWIHSLIDTAFSSHIGLRNTDIFEVTRDNRTIALTHSFNNQSQNAYLFEAQSMLAAKSTTTPKKLLGKHYYQIPRAANSRDYTTLQSGLGYILYAQENTYFIENLVNLGGNRYLFRNSLTFEPTAYPIIIAIAIGVVSSAIALLFLMQSRTRARAEEIAEFMTEQVRSKEERLRAASEGSNDGLWDWDVKNDDVWFSRRYYEMLGYEHDEFPPSYQAFHDLVHPDDIQRVEEVLHDHMQLQKPYDVTMRMQHKNGEWRWVRTRGQARWEDGKVVRMAGVHTDITAEKEYEIELANAKSIAESAARVKADFLANMSHEIRTPLNGIIGITELMQNTELTGKQSQYIHILQSSGQSLMRIVNDILDYSKLDAGQMKMEMIEFHLPAIITDVLELISPQLQSKANVELIFRYAPQLPQRFISDPTRLRQVLLNLLSNAMKFTNFGHILLDVDGVQVDAKRWNISIQVEDTGIGIPTEKQPYIFQKFTQADSSTTRKYGGTGLGLSIVQEIIKLLGGTISLTSQEGVGSKFVVQLPTLVDTHPDTAMPSFEVLKGQRFAVVDDNAVNRIILSELLEFHGAEVTCIESALQVVPSLDAAKQKGAPFHAVLLDFQMPELSGDMVARAIRSTPSIADIPMLMITSLARKGDGELMKSLGFKGYLQKPLIPEHVLFALASILSGKEDAMFVTRHSYTEAKLAHKAPQASNISCSTHDKILVVEDNPTNQQVISWILEDLSIPFVLAEHGKHALEILEKDRDIKLILMDCQMPVMDGFEATAAIRRRTDALATLPIVALTANTQPEDRERCLASGMSDYISKPVNAEKLRSVLEKFMAFSPEKAPDSIATSQEDSAIQHSEKLQAIDEKRLLDLTRNSADRIEKFNEMFSRAFHEHVKGIENAIRSHDSKALKMHAHTLKGASANLYALQIQALATRIEAAHTSPNMAEEVQSLLPAMHSAFKRFQAAVEELKARL